MRFVLLFLLSLVSLSFLGCGDSGGNATRISVIPKGTTHSYWKAVHAGARKAEAELNEQTEAGQRWAINWKGPMQEDQRDSQIEVVENFIGQNVDGLVLAPLDDRALVTPVTQAITAGIPVVVIDSGLKSDDIVSFCATDNFAGGVLAGDRLADLIDGEGKVMMLRYQVGSASTERREAGFLTALEKFPDIEVISSNQYAGPTRDTANTAAENLLNRYGDDVHGVFASNQSASNGMLLALRANGKAGGQIKFVGFDGGETNIEALRAGDIQGLVLQDPFKMGYKGVMAMAEHLQGESVPERIDTGATLVTPANIDNSEIQQLLHPPLEKYLK